MIKFISGIIVGTTITYIGWIKSVNSIVEFVMQIKEIIK